jgi:hypothetical protein
MSTWSITALKSSWTGADTCWFGSVACSLASLLCWSWQRQNKTPKVGFYINSGTVNHTRRFQGNYLLWNIQILHDTYSMQAVVYDGSGILLFHPFTFISSIWPWDRTDCSIKSPSNIHCVPIMRKLRNATSRISVYSVITLAAPASCSESVTVEIKKVHVGVIFLRAQFSSFFLFITSNVHYWSENIYCWNIHTKESLCEVL